MKSVSVREARSNFSELLNDVHFGKKQILITRSGKPFVILTSAKNTKQKNKKKHISSGK